MFITLGIGTGIGRFLPITKSPVLICFLGLFGQLIFTTAYAVFFPVNVYFYVINFLLSFTLLSFNSEILKQQLFQIKQNFNSFSKASKIFFTGFIVLTLLHSSALPVLPDNESYYIQTIKWLNQYGLVKGVINIHLFLGQFSGWHILQSSFNFYFLTDTFNDLNGFILIATSFLSFTKWEEFKKTNNLNALFIGLMPVSFLFIFLFVKSPSPEVPLLCIIPLSLYLFLEDLKNKSTRHFYSISMLCLLAVLIRVTVFPVLLLPLYFLLVNFKKRFWKFFSIVSLVSILSFIIKNSITSGYPFYPLSFGHKLIQVDWKLPESMQQASYQWAVMYGWKITDWVYFTNLSILSKFWLWLSLPGIDGLFNKLIIITLVVFTLLYFRRKDLRLLAIFFNIQFVVFYATSPQYRFFLPVLLSCGLFFLTSITYKKRILVSALYGVNIILLTVIGVWGMPNKLKLTESNHEIEQKWSASQFIKPKENTAFSDITYEKKQIDNLSYYAPANPSLNIWQTSNGPLPCVNKKLIEFFAEQYKYVPQMRTDNIKDGFYSAKAP